MSKLGEIVAFVDESGRAIYGRVLASSGCILVLLDTDGCFHRVVDDQARGVGQALDDGTILMASSRVAFNVSQDIEPMLADPFVEIAVKHLVRLPSIGILGKLDTGKSEPRRSYYQTFDAVPLKMFTGRVLDESGRPQYTRQFERYINDSDERRVRFDRLLRRMKQRAPAQHRVYVAVHLRGMTQAETCQAFGLHSGNVAVQLRQAREWMGARMGTNVSGV